MIHNASKLLALLLTALLALAAQACGDSSSSDDDSNNAENNSTANNSTANNSTANNSTANNSTANNSTANNSTANNSTENNSTENNHGANNHGANNHGANNHEEPPHWSYEGEAGPEHWGDLSPMYATCRDGQAQTPIDIASAIIPSVSDDLAFSYQPSALTILNNGHTAQVNFDAGSTFAAGERSWGLIQFHYHAHSEHTLDGATYPVELHLVHRDGNDALAVVGVFLEVDDEAAPNPALDAFVAHLPQEEQPATTIPDQFLDPNALLPESRETWRYDGSLTTPPCSEGVSWFVMMDSLRVPASQVMPLVDLYDHNYRPTQELHDRTISGQ